MKTLADVLRTHARAQPDATFLISPETGRTLSYGEFSTAVAGLQRMLDRRGVPVGGHVGFFLPNGLATTALFLGTMIAGRVVVPFNLLSQGAALGGTIAHSEVGLVFVDKHYRATLENAIHEMESAPKVQKAQKRVEIIEIDVDDPMFAAGEHAGTNLPQDVAISENDTALLMYTSGTTGAPKGALLTHKNVMHVGRTVSAWHGLTPRDRVLSSLPLYHINGQCIATVAPFFSGGSIVVPHKFSTGAWWGWVEAHRPTWLNVVPTIIAYLLNAPAQAHATQHVRFARSASAPLPPAHARAFAERFGIQVIEAMGMTECASMVFCNPQEAARGVLGSPGVPCGVDVKVIAANGTALGEGETGELCLRGDNVMHAYFNAPEKTAEAFDADGWLRTGDLGHRDGDGFYFVTGRIKELIIKGGENIAPREIDEALLAHPDVLEAAAYGAPDANYGQTVVAAVVLKENAVNTPKSTFGADLLIAHCVRVLGKYKAPTVIRFVNALPKGPSGKVQRLKLL